MKLFLTLLLAGFNFNGMAQNIIVDDKMLQGYTANKYQKSNSSFFAPAIFANSRSGTNGGIFNLNGSFIENVGQYGNRVAGKENLGDILFGYEGLGMPVLFTTNGIVYLQRKVKKNKEGKARQNEMEEEGEHKNKIIDGAITLQWINANPHPQVVAEGLMPGYHTFGLLAKKARLFNKITFKQVYPGIDIVYSLVDSSKSGFEYSIVADPWADVSKVKFKYGGNISFLKKDKSGNLIIISAIAGIIETVPVGYYSDSLLQTPNSCDKNITINTQLKRNEVSFVFPNGYDKTKTIIIDPFVTALNAFTAPSNNIAYDLDYDYEGNIYARGSGVSQVCQLAKFSKDGILQWVFHGSLSVPSWTFGFQAGGWVVDKGSGQIYVGQGYNLDGAQIIRLDASGVYDNYISTADLKNKENWKMFWICNGGAPQIYAAGGGTNSNINFSICSPPSPNLQSSNLTGIPVTTNQDAVDVTIDPKNNDMYTIFCSVQSAFLDNRIYKHIVPYTSNDISWSVKTGYTSLSEYGNRPYLTASTVSQNCIYVNESYLFYWDGKYLKAFNKADGSGVGTPLIVADNTVLQQNGIVADNCNNVFVGDKNGTIKVYKFDGNTFNDAAAPDITIPGYSTKSTYALAYNSDKKLMYATGQGYLASFDVSAYCNFQIYSVAVSGNCNAITAALSPVPPNGSIVTYKLYNAGVFVSSNTTGIFNQLVASTSYSVRAIINLDCSGIQVEKEFTLDGPSISSVATTTATCTQNIGTISVNGVSGSAPYSYSIDGSNFQNDNLFSNLGPATYKITLKDANDCIATKAAVVTLNITPPTVYLGKDTALCEDNVIVLNATNPGSIYLWQDNSTNPTYPVTKAGKYFVTVNEQGCIAKDTINISYNLKPKFSLGADGRICLGSTIILDPKITGVSYLWQDGSANQTYTVTQPGVYYVTSTNFCGSTTDDVTITNGICDLYIPNSFSPNGDGKNDLFKSSYGDNVAAFHLQVFNRYGQVIFESKDKNKGWDGTFKGIKQPLGVYVWVIQYNTDVNDKQQSLHGTVLLIR